MPTDSQAPGTNFEEQPLTRAEYITAMIHYYRGENSRANVWRQRLDATTNWAVAASAAIISFSFSTPETTHLLMLLTNFFVLGFLVIEARRFRFFSVYRARVRMLEENFILPIVTRNLTSPKPEWREFIAMDLDVPKFKNTLFEAVALRVRYNYYWIFSALALAWMLKTWLHPHPAHTLQEWYTHLAAEPLPGWLVLTVATVFFGVMTVLFFTAGRVTGWGEDEIHGLERDRAHWKF